VLLQEAERLVERQLGADRVQGHLGDLAQLSAPRIASGGDDLADERLARHDPEEAAAVADEHGADLRPDERLTGLLRARAAVELGRVDDHRVAHSVHHAHYG
jgi:hypothetical protein